jgi:pimeloyl-ACP methyl ester carboxylesterase
MRIVAWVAVFFMASLTGLRAEGPQPNAERMIDGHGGVQIATQEWGNPAGPAVVLIHGYAQSHLTWLPILQGDLVRDFRVITLDLRGHGNSEKPSDPAAYNRAAPWAGDIRAVIDGYGLEAPVLAGWSYGGLVIGDYLATYGGKDLGGIVLDGAPSAFGGEVGEPLIHPEFFEVAPKSFSADIRTLVDGTVAFVGRLTAEPVDAETYSLVFATNMLAPYYVRASMLDRVVDLAPVLQDYEGPALVIHGQEDAIVLPKSAERADSLLRDSKLVLFEGVGHTPHLEAAPRFEEELVRLANEAASRP